MMDTNILIQVNEIFYHFVTLQLCFFQSFNFQLGLLRIISVKQKQMRTF